MKLFLVDAFTSKPFAGNPAGVCLLLEEQKDDKWMQNIAAEVNAAETAFISARDEKSFNLRWFTPTDEVELCGHATLAAAHILWQEGILKESVQAEFYTQSGRLTAKKAGDKIELNFPALQNNPADPIPLVMDALGVEPVNFVTTSFNYLAELKSESEVRDLNPDINLLSRLKGYGVIVTARSVSSEYDFISRYFVPSLGINEDPVTGSAHCSLAVYWQAKLGKNNFTAYQASKRGGVLELIVEGDRVRILGAAVTVIKSELFV
jgi:PhzF family phenazine biosynthesis protein